MSLSDIFSYYDKLLLGVTPGYSSLISLGILLVLGWAIWRFVRGNFIWVVGIVIFIPAAWPALKSIGRFLLIIATFLLIHLKT